MSIGIMTNSFVNRAERKATRSKAYWRSPKQEKELTKRLVHGLQHSRSGAGSKKGDISVSRLVRVECKTTQQKSFNVSQSMIEQITNASLASDEIPIIVVEFLNEKAKPVSEVAILPLNSLLELINAVTAKTRNRS